MHAGPVVPEALLRGKDPTTADCRIISIDIDRQQSRLIDLGPPVS